MAPKLASEPPFGHIARHLGKLNPLHKHYYGFAPSDTWTPNVNLYESDACYLVCVDLAGVEKQQIDITVQNQRLRLTGKRAVPVKEVPEECKARLRIHLMEIDSGNFAREVELPQNVNHEKIAATFNNGLLWIELPKT